MRPAKRRSCNDYNVNIAGGFGASQLTLNYTEANRTLLPTKRRATKTARTHYGTNFSDVHLSSSGGG